MQKGNKIFLDGKSRTLFFKGSCLENLTACQALCCREWDVTLSWDEFKTGCYRAQIACLLKKNECENKAISCVNRVYKLRKKKDGSCVYLKENNTCRMYAQRPHVCKLFSCKKGWKVSSVVPVDQKKNGKAKAASLMTQHLLNNLTLDMVFMLNPTITAKSFVYAKSKNKIIFLEKRMNQCGMVSSSVPFCNPAIDDAVLLSCVSLFDGELTLAGIYDSLVKQCSAPISQNDFLAIIALLFEKNIILFKHSSC